VLACCARLPWIVRSKSTDARSSSEKRKKKRKKKGKKKGLEFIVCAANPHGSAKPGVAGTKNSG
jgi:hypothetical protein